MIKPAKLACSPTDTNVEVIAIGNGLMHPKAQDITPTLQYVQMKTIAKRKCFLYHPIFAYRRSILCTQGEDEHSVCRGDGGGPLIDAKSQNLVGIASFGSHLNKCNGAPQPFTHVPDYIEWIDNTTGLDVCNKEVD